MRNNIHNINKVSNINKVNKNDPLCWYCKFLCGKVRCSWSYNFIPVRGWYAKEVKIKDCIKNNYTKSYLVKDCSLFQLEN